MERAVLFSENGDLTLTDLPHEIRTDQENAVGTEDTRRAKADSLSNRIANREREILERVLQAHDNRRTDAAKTLGISRTGLYKRLHKYGLMEK